MPSPPPSKFAAYALPALGILIVAAAVAEHFKEEQDRRTRAELITEGNVDRGRQAFTTYGCGGCHSLTGVPAARGLVGPTLDGIGSRVILGGRVENTPQNMMRWIADPQGVSPGTAMPNLGLTPRDQRDIAAFLYDRS
jgi:cytochrome c2